MTAAAIVRCDARLHEQAAFTPEWGVHPVDTTRTHIEAVDGNGITAGLMVSAEYALISADDRWLKRWTDDWIAVRIKANSNPDSVILARVVSKPWQVPS